MTKESEAFVQHFTELEVNLENADAAISSGKYITAKANILAACKAMRAMKDILMDPPEVIEPITEDEI